MHILPDGYIRLCSLGTNSKMELDMQRARDKNGNVMHILTHSIEEIMNSDKHVEVRKNNITDVNQWSRHCECCEIREKITNFDRTHPNKSRRIYLMDIETDDIVTEYNFKDISNTGIIDWMPNSLDIRFGNLCNQKCVMCGPVFSNLWYDEYEKFYKKTTFGQGKIIKFSRDSKTNKWIDPPELNWFEDPRWWEKFETMMPHLRHIYVTGGEPMITPAHDEMLDRLIKSNNAKNIWLEYDSNCSAINNKIIERWGFFKKVHIRGSMDAANEQYELIRYGGKWEKFKKNVIKLKELSIKSKGQINLLSLTSCFQIPTMYSVIDAEKFCNEIGVPFHLRFLEGPVFLSVSSISKESKEELIEYYQQNKDKTTKHAMIINYLKNNLDKKFNKSVIERYFQFMNFLDDSRKTDWKTTLPEVYKLLSI
jgi:hypothetical protein